MRPEPSDTHSPLPPAEAQAAAWMVRKRDGAMTANDEREFQVWLGSDPAHRAAYAKVERYWQMLGAIGDDAEIIAITEQRARQFNRPARNLRLAAAVAGVAVVAAGAWALLGGGGTSLLAPPDPPQEQAFRTSVGQRSTVTLPDGSIVTLDTDSELRTRETRAQRYVALDHGRAFFKVAKDASRPFVVAAAGKTVTATGTEFEVATDAADMTVILAQGRVRVEAPREPFRRGQIAELQPGWRLTAHAGAGWRTERVDVDKQTSWITGRLHFFNDPLSSAVAEMNRYSEKKIVIRNAAIAARPIVGNFRAGDVDGFVRAMRLYGFARVKVETDDVVELDTR